MLFRRAMRLLGDEAAAVRATEELYVRLAVYGRRPGAAGDGGAGALLAWTYRAATNYCLQRLPDDTRAAGDGPLVSELRRLDEVGRNAVVLRVVDGLSIDEIAGVLGVPAAAVRRKVALHHESPAPAPELAPAPHPSALELDGDRASIAAHLAACARCRARAAEDDRWQERFEREIAPAAGPRVAAAVRAERARRRAGPRWGRALWLGGAAVGVAALALLVARPPVPDRDTVPYAGLRGASRTRAAGIEIAVRRGEEVRPLQPATAVRAGDRLHFKVRAERPRHLELRARTAAGEVTLFPAAGTTAALVRPGQALDADYVVAGTDRRIWIVARFADHPFPLGRPAGPGIEVVPIALDRE
jgi:DNA-directed RNA polymerase specialized sigma24 family protein